MISLGLVASAGLVALGGGLHCASMCSGFVAATAARDAARSDGAIGGSATRKETIGDAATDGSAAGARTAPAGAKRMDPSRVGISASSVPLLPARVIARGQWLYHSGRILMYMLQGALLGATGAAAVGGIALLPVQRALYLAGSAFLIVLALGMLNMVPSARPLQRAAAALFVRVMPRLTPRLCRPGSLGRFSLGLLWGLVPCGLVYAALPIALFAGGAWQGATVMLAFGLGTLPALLGGRFALATLEQRLGARARKVLLASILIALGLAGVYRSLWNPEALAQSWFCA